MAALSTIPKNKSRECDLTGFLKILLPDRDTYDLFVKMHFDVDVVESDKRQKRKLSDQKAAVMNEKLEASTNQLIGTLVSINDCFRLAAAESQSFPKSELTNVLLTNRGIKKDVRGSLLFLGKLYMGKKTVMDRKVQDQLDKYRVFINAIGCIEAPSQDFLLQTTDNEGRSDKEAGQTMLKRLSEVLEVDKKQKGKEKVAKTTIKPSKAPDRKQAVRNAKIVIDRTVEKVKAQPEEAPKKSARQKEVKEYWEEVWEQVGQGEVDSGKDVIEASPDNVHTTGKKITIKVPVEDIEWKLITFERENPNLAYFTMSARSAENVKKLFWAFSDFSPEQRQELSQHKHDYLSKAVELSYDFDCRRQMREPARPKHRGLGGALLKIEEKYYKMADETVCAIDGLAIGDNSHRCDLCHVAFSDRMHCLLNASESDQNSTFCLVHGTPSTGIQTINDFVEENKVYKGLLQQQALDDSDGACVDVDDEVEVDSQCCFWKVSFVDESPQFTFFKVFPYNEFDTNVIVNLLDSEQKALAQLQKNMQRTYKENPVPPVVRVPRSKFSNLNRAYMVEINGKKYALYNFRHRLGYDYDNLFDLITIFWDEWHSTYDQVSNSELEKDMVWYPDGLNVSSQFSGNEDGNEKTMHFKYNGQSAFSFKISATGDGLNFERQDGETSDNITVFAGNPVVDLDFDPEDPKEGRAGLVWMVPPTQYLQRLGGSAIELQNVPDEHSFIMDTFKVKFTMKAWQSYVHDKLGGFWPTLNCFFLLNGLPYVPISRMQKEKVLHVDNRYFWFWQDGGVYFTVAETIQIAGGRQGGLDDLRNDVYVFRNGALPESDPDYEFLASFEDVNLQNGKCFKVKYKAASKAVSVQQNVRVFLSQHKQPVICFYIVSRQRILQKSLDKIKGVLTSKKLTDFKEITGEVGASSTQRTFTVTPEDPSQMETNKLDIVNIFSTIINGKHQHVKFSDAPPLFTGSELDLVEDTLRKQRITTIEDVMKIKGPDDLTITDDTLKNKTWVCLQEAVKASKESWSAGTISGDLFVDNFSCTPAQCRDFKDSASNWKFADGFRKWDQCPSRTSFDTLAGFKVPKSDVKAEWENSEGVILAQTLCAHCEDLFVRQQYSQAPEVHPRTRFELLQSFFYQYEHPNQARLDHHEYLTASERGMSVYKLPGDATPQKALGKLNSVFFKFCPAVHQWRYTQSKISPDEESADSFYCKRCFAKGRILFHDEDTCQYPTKNEHLAHEVDMRPFWVTVGWKDNDLEGLFNFPVRGLRYWCKNWESYEAHRADYLQASVLAKIQPFSRRRNPNTFEKQKTQALQGMKSCIARYQRKFEEQGDIMKRLSQSDSIVIMERFKRLKKYGLGTLEELMEKRSKLQTLDVAPVKHHHGLQALVDGTESLWEFFRTRIWDGGELSEEEARTALMRKVVPFHDEGGGSDSGDDSDVNLSDQESDAAEEFDDDDMVVNEVGQTQLDELNDNENNFDQVNVFKEVMSVSSPDLNSNFTLTEEEINRTLTENLQKNLNDGCVLTIEKAGLLPPGNMVQNLLQIAKSATPTTQDIVGGMGSQIQIDRSKFLECFFQIPLSLELQDILNRMEKSIRVSTGHESVQTGQKVPEYTVLEQQKLTYHLFLIASILHGKAIALKVREWQVLQSVDGQVQSIAANPSQLREVFALQNGVYPVRIKKNESDTWHTVQSDADEPNPRVLPPMFPCRLQSVQEGGAEGYEMPSGDSDFFRKFTLNAAGKCDPSQVSFDDNIWVSIFDGQTADGGEEYKDLNNEQILEWDGLLRHPMRATDAFDIHDYFLVTSEGIRKIHKLLAEETEKEIKNISLDKTAKDTEKKEMENEIKELKEELKRHKKVSDKMIEVPGVVLQIEGMAEDTISFRRHEYTASPSPPEVLNVLKGQYVLTSTQISENLQTEMFKFNPMEVFPYQRVRAKKAHKCSYKRKTVISDEEGIPIEKNSDPSDTVLQVAQSAEGTVYKKSNRRVFVLWDKLHSSDDPPVFCEYDALYPECFDLIDFRPIDSGFVAMDYIEEGSGWKLVPDFDKAGSEFLKDMLGNPDLMINPFYYTFTMREKTFTCCVAPTEMAEIPNDLYAFIVEAVFLFDWRQTALVIDEGTKRKSSIAKQNDEDDLFDLFFAFCAKESQTGKSLNNLFKTIAEKYAPSDGGPLTFEKLFGDDNESLRFFYKNLSIKIQNTKEDFLSLFGDPLAPDAQTIEGCFVWKETKKDDQAWEKDSKTFQTRIEAEGCLVPGMRVQRERDSQNDNDEDGDAALQRAQNKRNKVKVSDTKTMAIRQDLQACMWNLETAVFTADASGGVELKKHEAAVYDKIKELIGGDEIYNIFIQKHSSNRGNATVSEFFSYVMKWMYYAQTKTTELMMAGRAGNDYVMEEVVRDDMGGETPTLSTESVDRVRGRQAMRSTRSDANFIKLHDKMIMFVDATFDKNLKDTFKQNLEHIEWKKLRKEEHDGVGSEPLKIQPYHKNLGNFVLGKKEAFMNDCLTKNIQDSDKLCAVLEGFHKHMESVKYKGGDEETHNGEYAFLLDLAYEGNFSCLFEIECLKTLLSFVDYWTFNKKIEPKTNHSFFDFMVILFEHVIDKSNCKPNSSFAGSQFRVDVSNPVQLYVILLLQKLIRFFTVKLGVRRLLNPEIAGSKKIHHLFIGEDGVSGSDTDTDDEEESEDDFDDGGDWGLPDADIDDAKKLEGELSQHRDEPVPTARSLLRQYFLNEASKSNTTLDPSHANATGIEVEKVQYKLLPTASSQDQDIERAPGSNSASDSDASSDSDVHSDSDDSSHSVANADETPITQVKSGEMGYSSDESSAEDEDVPDVPGNDLGLTSDESDEEDEDGFQKPLGGEHGDAESDADDDDEDGEHGDTDDGDEGGEHDDSDVDDEGKHMDSDASGKSDSDSHSDDGGEDSDAEDVSQVQILEMIRLAQKRLHTQFKDECNDCARTLEDIVYSDEEIEKFRQDISNFRELTNKKFRQDISNFRELTNKKRSEGMDLLLKWCQDMKEQRDIDPLVILYNRKREEYTAKLEVAYTKAAEDVLGKDNPIRIDTDKKTSEMKVEFLIDMLITICSHLTAYRETYYYGNPEDSILVPPTLTVCLGKLMPPSRARNISEPFMSINWTVRNAHLFRVDENSGDLSDAFSRQHQYTKSYNAVDINPSIFDLMAVAGQNVEKHESAYLGISYAAWHASRFLLTDEMDKDLRAFFIQPLESGRHMSCLLRAFSYFVDYIQTDKQIQNSYMGDPRVEDSVHNDTVVASNDDSGLFDNLNGLCCEEDYLSDMKNAIAKVFNCEAREVTGEYVRNKQGQKDDRTGGWQLKLFQIFSYFFTKIGGEDNFQNIVTILSLLTGIDLLFINDKQKIFDSAYNFDDGDADATDDDGASNQVDKVGENATEKHSEKSGDGSTLEEEHDEESEDGSELEEEEDLLNKTVVAFVEGEVYLFVKVNLDDKEKGGESEDESEEED